MNEEILPDAGYGPWGPFISDRYQLLKITRLDIALASTAFALAGVFAILAAYTVVRQSRRSAKPWKSVYLWMVWLEWAASVVIAIECLLFLLRVIRPSFYFYMSILFCWTIQIQLLLQIIINRIRIILQSRRRGQQLMWGTAFIISLLCLSVYIIWIPASLQISPRWVRTNTYWDRVEKVIYLFVDAALNVYFIRVVKGNLVKNGLHKYDRLVRFNQRMIVVSILMDVMIIAAMDIPNGFVYAIFHPLAYLIKLNIEMSMADLITRVALGTRVRPVQAQTPVFVGTQPASSSVTTKPPSSAHRTFLRSLSRGIFKRTRDQPQQNEDVISTTRDFAVRSSLALGPDSVQMVSILEETPPSGTSLSNPIYPAGPRSAGNASSISPDDLSLYSTESEEVQEHCVDEEGAKPESVWPSTKWSEIRLDRSG
ncbi:hypothetical protein IAQ61_006681 [Plenodomus lingam]|uniref:Integral membrane protein n=1 Tax=Leptosphaeria maculans (strain JN3 / isolate v23.1.3 / race Av1-4-5-6-7-8) TaxID=985895 RepID=E5AC91_LEPMJ|nr:hypothetical protein LEMA_P008800.1 [Plenodomus lingam JN3]KAH9869475.1 hypothetical protein IAQ61_006681 [Plenodomus lingam]CBY02093.1 hypothetical protein LEMA_P008800.1 [Plenodomus lingam JN3]